MGGLLVVLIVWFGYFGTIFLALYIPLMYRLIVGTPMTQETLDVLTPYYWLISYGVCTYVAYRVAKTN